MATQSEIRASITNRIVEALKAGTPPWRRPWSGLLNTGGPANVTSKRPYTGVNPLLLHLVALERGYASRWWGTFRQWAELGLRVQARPADVKPGEWGTKIVFCKAFNKRPAPGQADEGQEGGPAEGETRIFLLRQYTVFNAGQVEGDGVERFLARPRAATAVEDYAAEEVITATGADICFGGGRAVYDPEEDVIRLPPKESFVRQHEYYATVFHELGHWTGHARRLNRPLQNARFGDAAYAFEELVAEMSGCFTCSEVGVPQSDDLSNQVAYLASWLKVLRNDASAILTAASQASAACDFVLSFSRAGETDGATTVRING
jgi:antirestriction protein ArdC